MYSTKRIILPNILDFATSVTKMYPTVVQSFLLLNSETYAFWLVFLRKRAVASSNVCIDSKGFYILLVLKEVMLVLVGWVGTGCDRFST